MKRLLLILSIGGLFAGCQSYNIIQRSYFADEDGNTVEVSYGRSEEDHINYFPSPSTGKPIAFRSKLVVEVLLPDGDDFVAWQCMNNLVSSGTMYRSDDEEWMLLVTGFSCMIYLRNEEDEARYDEIYRGILFDTSKGEYQENPKWRKLKKNAAGKWE